MPNPTTQAALLPRYAQLLSTVKITDSKKPEIKAIADRILTNLARYKLIESNTRIPWWFIAGLHSLEASGDFSQHLANGDPINSCTVNEPTGIPAGTWEECAIAALELKGWLEPDTIWENLLIAIWRAERYNGWGYQMYHDETPSPYLWGGTNHQKPGKYVSDGKWDGDAVSEQIGVVAIWMALGIDLRSSLEPPPILSVSISDVSNLKPVELTSLEDLAKESADSIGTLSIGHRTCFKDKPLSSDTPGMRIVWVDPGCTEYDIIQRFADENGHYHLLLRLPSGKEIEVYIYGLHAVLKIRGDDGSGRLPLISSSATPKFTTEFASDQYKKLCEYAKSGVANLNTKTTYYSQRDNYTMGGRTCNSSSSAMLLDWWRRAAGMESLGGDDDYLRKVLQVGDTIYHENQTAAIAKYGFKSKWMSPEDELTEEDFNRVDGLLDNGFPVTVNILHRGSENAPTGGHIIMLIARRKSEGTYCCHDPYGTFSSGYTNTNGRYSLISRSSFRNRWQGGHRVLS